MCLLGFPQPVLTYSKSINGSTRTICEICSELSRKTQEWHKNLLDMIYLGTICLFLAWARHRTTRWHPRCLERCVDGKTRPGIAAGTVALSVW